MQNLGTRNSQEGIALLLVLWVLILLTVIVGQFCYTIRTELKITRNFRDETKGYYLARAGLNSALLAILNPKSPKQPSHANGDNEELKNQGIWRANTDIAPVELADGRFQVEIDNESGKFNINVADSPMLTMMLKPFHLPDIQKYTIVESIIDWRDMDHFHRFYGAENDYYQSLPNPYNCNNGPFRTIDELLLVRGVTKELFEDGLREMITVYKDPDKQKQQTLTQNIKPQKDLYKINLNAAPDSVLRCLPKITDEDILAINEFRQKQNFRFFYELKNIIDTDVYKEISNYLTLDESTYYTIRATGNVNESRTSPTIEAVVRINRRMQEYDIIKWVDYKDKNM